MLHVAVTWSVLVGLTGPAQAPVRRLEQPVPAAEPEGPALPEAGTPLWSYCRPELGSRKGARASGPSRRAADRHAADRSAEHPEAESVVAETPVPASWLPCLPGAPGLAGESASSMGSSGDDGEDAPICVEDVECSPVSPKQAPYTVSFSASKAVIFVASLPPLAPVRLRQGSRGPGGAAPGFPEPPFEPPRGTRPA